MNCLKNIDDYFKLLNILKINIYDYIIVNENNKSEEAAQKIYKIMNGGK